jgi:hypothetical protein
MWGETGVTRLFDGVSGGMVAWLIPAALLLTGFALVALRGLPRTDPTRAALVMWSACLVTIALVFSFMAGIYHDYYTVALAPAIAGAVALGAHMLWQRRTAWLGRIGLATALGVTTVWAVVLMGRATGEPYASLQWVIGVAGALATVGLLFSHRLPKALAAVVIALALLGGVTGPAAYSVQTAATPHQGSIVTAGPVTERMGGARGPGGQPDGRGLGRPGAPAQGVPGTQPGGTGTRPGGTGGFDDGGRGGMGGLLGGAQVSAETATALQTDAEGFTWVAAAVGAQSAADYQLATGLPVMAIGGFNGSDPSPTLDEFKALVAAGQVHYFVGGGRTGGQQNGGSSSSADIAAWVTETFTATAAGGVTLYDLTASS